MVRTKPDVFEIRQNSRILFFIIFSNGCTENDGFSSADWKRFIDPEILQRDLGSDYRAIYGNERFEGDIAGVFNDASVSQVKVSVNLQYLQRCSRKMIDLLSTLLQS